MIEWLAIPAVIAGAAFIPKSKIKPEKVIQMVFENKKVCVKRGDNFQYPKLKRKVPNEGYDTYLYSMPYGLHTDDIEEVVPAIKEALNKEIEIDVDGLLKIDVYHEDLPEKWKYDEDLSRPNTWEVPIGKNHKGILYHDFDKYPHFIIGGVTRFGKTVLIKSIFNTLLLNNPDNVEFYFLDLKGGLEFFKYKSLPQVKEVACNVYEAAETLGILVDGMEKAEQQFKRMGLSNIVGSDIKKRTFIIIDEGADLSPQIAPKDQRKYAEFCQSALTRLISKGGAVGLRVCYCTQYPSTKSVDMSIKANIVSRLSFIAASRFGSQVILDESGAEDLPAIPGRAIYKVERKRTVQVPYIDDKMMFQMMEGRKDVILNSTKGGNPSNNHRPAGNGENQTPTANT